MDMLTGEQIAETNLTDWRKLGQGLHARYVVGGFGTGVRFVAAVGEAGDALGHHPRATIAPVWAALLTGSTDARGRGTIGDDVRDATGRVPILWFQDTDEHETPRQRFHIDVWVPPEVAEQRIAAAVTAGGIVVDDSQAPSYTVIADQDGNKACVCTTLPAARKR